MTTNLFHGPMFLTDNATFAMNNMGQQTCSVRLFQIENWRPGQSCVSTASNVAESWIKVALRGPDEVQHLVGEGADQTSAGQSQYPGNDKLAGNAPAHSAQALARSYAENGR